MNDTPQISLVIPVYNVENYLANCLDSAFAQTFDSFEVVCVDDGSTDASPEILARYAEAHENLRIVRKENGGLSSARNAGLDAARGEYVWFVDGDDAILGEDALARLTERAIEARADMLNFGGEAKFQTDALMRARPGLNKHLHIANRYPDGLSGRDLYVRMVDGWDYISSACLHLFRRNFLEENHLRFAEGLLFEDQLFTLQCFSLAQRTAVQQGHYYLYCVREGSIMSASKLQRQADSYYRIAAKLEDFYGERLGDASPDFHKRYFYRVRLLTEQGTDCLMALPARERKALLRALDPRVRRIARADLLRFPGRALVRRLRAAKRKIRRCFH